MEDSAQGFNPVLASIDEEMFNMSEGDLSNIEKAPLKVDKYLNHDFITAKETFAKYNEVMVSQTILMLDKVFT